MTAPATTGALEQLERIIAEGTRRGWGRDAQTGRPSNVIRCVDGFRVSVIAGAGTYCTPRPDGYGADAVDEDYGGPYTKVEVGYPSEPPEPWDTWQRFVEDPANRTETVYAYVPVDVVRALIAAHEVTR